MKKFYVRTHMGLGDMILCNGLVRNICKKFDKVVTFVKPEYKESIFFMYRDLHNLEVIPLHETDIDNLLHRIEPDSKIVVGFGNIEHLLETYRFDECFYKQIGLNFQRRWDDFYVDRDIAAEQKLMQEYGLEKNNYIFIHDDHDRGYKISESLLPADIKHFRPDSREKNIFNYCTIIENARQVHVMDSCFKHVADSLQLNNELFYHVYVRSSDNHHMTGSRNKWKLYI